MRYSIELLSKEYQSLRRALSKIEHSDMLSDCSFIDSRAEERYKEIGEKMHDIECFVSMAGEEAYRQFKN